MPASQLLRWEYGARWLPWRAPTGQVRAHRPGAMPDAAARRRLRRARNTGTPAMRWQDSRFNGGSGRRGAANFTRDRRRSSYPPRETRADMKVRIRRGRFVGAAKNATPAFNPLRRLLLVCPTRVFP